MAAFGRLAWWFTFTADQFDHASELPAKDNAGNRFYGVAEFVSAGLNARGMESSVFDEDFGWMVHAPLPNDGVFEVAVYHNPERDSATVSDWALLVRSVSKYKWLGFVPRVRNESLIDRLRRRWRRSSSRREFGCGVRPSETNEPIERDRLARTRTSSIARTREAPARVTHPSRRSS